MYVAWAIGHWFDSCSLKYVFLFAIFFKVFFFARRLQNGFFFDPYSYLIRSLTIHNDFQRFFRSFYRIWKARRKNTLILQIHKSITVFFLWYSPESSYPPPYSAIYQQPYEWWLHVCMLASSSPLTYEENKDKTWFWKSKFFSNVLFQLLRFWDLQFIFSTMSKMPFVNCDLKISCIF